VAEAGHCSLAARLRTGPPLRIINLSSEGLLVESTVRMLPGHPVDLVLHAGAEQVTTRGLVVHSQVGVIRGAAELRYLVGLWLAAGTNYSRANASKPAGERTTRVEFRQWHHQTRTGK
jgi:hypothetical protein